MLQEHLKQLKTELELEDDFISDVPGVWTIPLDEGVFVVVSTLNPQGFSLSCIVGPCPADTDEDLLNQMMLSNLFGKGTNGAILGIDESEKNVVLTQHVEYDANYQQFKDILEDFLNSVDVWREEINQKKS